MNRALRVITAVRLPRWWSIPMVPLISVRERRRIVSASNPLSRSPLYPRGVMSSFTPRWYGCIRVVTFGNVGADDHIGPHAALSNSVPYGPDTRPARMPYSRKTFLTRRTGRRPRRPTISRRISFNAPRTGRTPGRPVSRIPEKLSLEAVRAAALGGPWHYRIPTAPLFKRLRLRRLYKL